LVNGWNNGNDHGLFAGSGEPGVTAGTPHAPFFYMYYFQKYFGDVMVGSTVSANSSIMSYASSFSSGESGVVVVNKSTTAQIVDLKMKNFSEARSFYRFVLTGGTDNGSFSRKVFVNGEGPAQAGGGPKNYETVKAFGKSIYGNAKFEVPPLSVTYVLVSGDSIPVTTGIENYKSAVFNIYPNPTIGDVNVQSPDFEYNKLEIINLVGKKVVEMSFDQSVTETKQFQFNLNSGIYILNLYNSNKKISGKLIVK